MTSRVPAKSHKSWVEAEPLLTRGLLSCASDLFSSPTVREECPVPGHARVVVFVVDTSVLVYPTDEGSPVHRGVSSPCRQSPARRSYSHSDAWSLSNWLISSRTL